MTSERLPRATHAGELKIGDITIPCAVLEDGRRVLTQRGLLEGLDLGTGGGKSGERKMVTFAAKLAESGCDVAQLSASANNPIRFVLPRGGTTYARGGSAFAYPAEVLAEICEAVLSARDAGRFAHDNPIVARCDRLLRGFARVGLVALVDEATGYQADRKRDELQKILAAYIAPELLPWTKRFPDEFYEQMFRLLGWEWEPGKAAKPGVVGHLTNLIVYERLPDGVLEELRRKNPTTEPGRRRHKHHMWLSADIGQKHLNDHLLGIIPMMRGSKTWKGFVQIVVSAWPKPNDQLALFNLDDWKPPEGA
jgi:hypothetical protein